MSVRSLHFAADVRHALKRTDSRSHTFKIKSTVNIHFEEMKYEWLSESILGNGRYQL